MARAKKAASATLVNPRVAAYCRVSSEDQAERQTIDAQRDFLARYVDLHQIDCHDVYVDDGVSGTIPLQDRPDGRRLLSDAQAGRFGSVLVYRLDRLGRDLRSLLEAHDQLETAGVAIRSATEPFDTSTPIGQFLFQLLGSLAELEKSTIVERMTLGRDRVARAGKWTNGYVPLGYDLDAAGCLVPSERLLPHGEREADLVRGIFERVAAGATLLAECQRLEALGVPSIRRRAGRPDEHGQRWWQTRLHKMLRKSLYCDGQYRLESRNGPVSVPVPPLVTVDLWQRARASMTQNRDLSRVGNATVYLLRGLVRCGTQRGGEPCGHPYGGGPGGPGDLPGGGRRRYYRCAAGRQRSALPARPACIGRAVRMETLDRIVWNDVREVVSRPAHRLADARARLDEQATSLTATDQQRVQIAAAFAAKFAERERAHLLFRRGLADLDETEAALRAIQADADHLERLLAALDVERAAVDVTRAHLTEIELLLHDLAPLVAAGDAGDREAMRQVIDAIVRQVDLQTELCPPTKRDQQGPQKRVRILIRYLFNPCGGFPDDHAQDKLPHASALTWDRELVLPGEAGGQIVPAGLTGFGDWWPIVMPVTSILYAQRI